MSTVSEKAIAREFTPEEIEEIWKQQKDTKHPMEYILSYDYLNKLYQQQTGTSLKY